MKDEKSFVFVLAFRPPLPLQCMVCEYDEGKYIVYSDDRAPCSPCAMCEDCHQSLHLDTKEKELYGGYQMYRYPTGVPRET